MEKTTPKIEDWDVRTDPNPYIAPEMRTSYLTGDVYGHPDFPDGQSIKTSPIVARSGNSIVTLSGHKYILGKPSQRYETKYPDATQRLLGSLKVIN